MVGRIYQVKRRQIKKEGKNDGGKNRKKKERKKKKEKKKERKKKRKKKRGKKRRSQQNKRKEREKEGGGGEEDRMKGKREKKKLGSSSYLNKRKDCVGSEPSALVYIGILVTSTTTGHDGSVVSALASQAKGGVQFPVVARAFFPTSIFFRTSVKKVIEQTINLVGFCPVMPRPPN